jgi:lambda family phage tail tape measure protein
MSLGKAVIVFAADTVQFAGDIARATDIFSRGVGRMLNQTLGLKAALASTFSVAGAGYFFKGIVDQADALGKLSEKVGITTEKLSELKLAAKLGDLNDESFNRGLRDFNRMLVEASDTSSKASRIFRALGVDIKQGPERAFRDFVDAFSKLPEGELRTAVAMEVLKKSGAEWIPILAQGTKGLDDAAEKARSLGLVVSTDFARQAQEFNENIKLIQSSTLAFGMAITKGALPALSEMAQRIEAANERGQKWKGIFTELRLLMIATGGNMAWTEQQAQQRQQAFDEIRNPPRQTVSGKIRNAEAAWGTPGGLPAPDPEAVRRAVAESEALYKRQMLAIQQMEEKKRSLFNLNEQELMLLRITEGSYKDFDVETKVRLLNLALEIDLRAEHNRVLELGIPAMQAEFDALERGGEILREYRVENQAQLGQLQLEIDLVGRTAREQEILNANRAIDLQLLAKKRQAAAAYGDDVQGLSIELIRLESQATIQRRQAIDLIVERQQKERDWLVGAKAGLKEYAEAATNAAQNARDVVNSSFRSMEDAIVEFARTGKLQFRDLAQSIALDLVRAGVRQNITGPLAGALGVSIGNLFGGANALPAGAIAEASGGIVGSSGRLPLSFYAGGGVASTPQLAVFGEGSTNEAFVPLPDGKSIPVNLRGGRSGGDVYQIDARNADAAGLARLEAMIVALNGSIERRAVGGLRREYARRGVRTAL